MAELIRKGPGVRHANAAIAAEVFDTLAATHGNSAQAKSLRAILDRATVRFTAKIEKIAAKQAANGEGEGEESGGEESPAPAPAKAPRKARKARKAAAQADDDGEAPALDAPFCRPCLTKIAGDVDAHIESAAHSAAVDAIANGR